MLIATAAIFSLLGLALIVAGIAALLRLRPLRTLVRVLAGSLLLALGVIGALLAVGTAGYRALTHEALALRVDIVPAAPQHFTVAVRWPDGSVANYALAGDEIYVDAKVLKWKPWANVLGLYTSYQMDRIAGRYHDLAQEQSAPRTVFALNDASPVDLFALRRKFAQLAPAFDAEYGSATFVPADAARSIEVRVSSTGLLIREAAAN